MAWTSSYIVPSTLVAGLDQTASFSLANNATNVYCALFGNAVTPNVDADPQYYGDAIWTTGNEVTGTNWAAGGVPLLLGAPAPGLSTNPSGGSLTTGTYEVEVSYTWADGESAASTSSSQAISGAQELVIASPPALSGATGWYAYVTQAGATTFYHQQTAGSPTSIGTALTLTANPTTTGALAPAGPGGLTHASGGFMKFQAGNVSVANTTISTAVYGALLYFHGLSPNPLALCAVFFGGSGYTTSASPFGITWPLGGIWTLELQP